MSINLDDVFRTYIVESRELLQQMEDGLLMLETNAQDKELINSIFRAAHTIKGSAGMFSLDDIVHFTHHVEHLLDLVRNDKCTITAELVEVLLASKDHIDVLVANADDNKAATSAADLAQQNALIAKLEVLCGATAAAGRQALSVVDAPVPDAGRWHISARFGRDILAYGNDLLPMLRYLGQLGEITAIVPVMGHVPTLRELAPGQCHIGFEAVFQSDATRAQIETAFEFVHDESSIDLIPCGSPLARYQERLKALPEPPESVVASWLECTAISESLADALLGRSPEQGLALEHEAGGDTQLARQAGGGTRKPVEERVIRVESEKLDALINLVGELVIAGAGAAVHAEQLKNTDLTERLELLTRLVEQVRDSALSLRMVQIGTVFNRFQRVVRDVAKELGKEIDLVISGAETELDKTLVEKISDPLMHLVRNSMDHGLETSEERIKAGKPARGTLRLNSHHDSGSVVIEVSDDGRGLNRDKILEKAIARGLVDRNQNLSDKEVWNLIFEAGFSTADKITNISGRGVGMDVVRRNIASLRGTVELQSNQGAGTCVRIRLPLTLAIIDGFVVSVGGAKYVIPLDLVVECIDLGRPEYQYTADRDFISLREEALPFIRMRRMFDIPGFARGRENLVVVAYAGQRAGLVVDALLGESQTVIKPLGRVFERLRGIGGSTILGSGEVALIIDVPNLIAKAMSHEREKLAAA